MRDVEEIIIFNVLILVILIVFITSLITINNKTSSSQAEFNRREFEGHSYIIVSATGESNHPMGITHNPACEGEHQ